MGGCTVHITSSKFECYLRYWLRKKLFISDIFEEERKQLFNVIMMRKKHITGSDEFIKGELNVFER